MTGAIITRSAKGAAAFTLTGLPRYVLVESERSVVSVLVPISPPASDEKIKALRQQIRDAGKDPS